MCRSKCIELRLCLHFYSTTRARLSMQRLPGRLPVSSEFILHFALRIYRVLFPFFAIILLYKLVCFTIMLRFRRSMDHKVPSKCTTPQWSSWMSVNMRSAIRTAASFRSTFCTFVISIQGHPLSLLSRWGNEERRVILLLRRCLSVNVSKHSRTVGLLPHQVPIPLTWLRITHKYRR